MSLAIALRSGRTKTLGLVVPDASNPFFAELARAVEDVAYARGRAVLVCNSADDPGRERDYITSLAERRIDGLVLVSATAEQDLSVVSSLQIPVIALERSPDDSPVSTIRSDNERAARRGTEHLLWHGHPSVGFISGPDVGVSALRREGWRSALADAGRDAHRAAMAPFTHAGGYEAVTRLLRGGMPTSLLVASDVQALGAIRALADRGLRVPRDVAVVSVDGTTAGRYSVPGLTTIAQPIRDMGEAAVSHLIERSAETSHLSLAGELVIRASCGCPDPSDGATRGRPADSL